MNSSLRKIVAAGAAVALGALALSAVTVESASADTQPPTGTPATVSSDPLPTVQIDGVAWVQKVVGNTVFVGGKFTTARPAGAAPGTNTVTRNNFLAYNVQTGELISSINLNMNAQVFSMAVSPDQSRLYVGGDFTTVNGEKHNRIVAVNTSDGSVIKSFTAGTWSRVSGLGATNDTVYAGGNFDAVGSGTPRAGLAAFRASDGAILNWAPAIGGTSARVNSMTMSPSGTKVIVGGNFATVNGVSAIGMTAIDAATGTVLPWQANTVIHNQGTSSAILSLESDATSVYGSGYTYGPGDLEGAFKADGETGQIQWIEDCHGDTYSVWPMNDALYNVGHAHYCGNIGGFPQTDPWTFHRGLAFSKAATGTITRDPYGYKNFQGNPSPTPLHWYPEIDAGSYTGQTQGAWSVSGNGQYLVAGGEFPRVNGVAQQGLVRFAVKEASPNKQGPVLRWANFVPNLAELPTGGVRGRFTTNWDTDNQALTYKVVRDGQINAPIRTASYTGEFWKPKSIGFVDQNVKAGQTYNYRLYATDPYGNTTQGNQVSITATKDGAVTPYVKSVLESGANLFWRLGETTGNAQDWAGSANGSRGAGVTGGGTGSILNDADASSTLSGTSTGLVASQTAVSGPQAFSIEGWIKTTTTKGGKIVGFGNAASGTSSSYDRHIYMRNDGKLVFGIYNGAAQVATSANAYNDGQWHQVVGTMDGTEGIKLYVDGLKVADNVNGKPAQSYNGYWRVGGDNLGGWPGASTSQYFAGSVDDVSIYPHALGSNEVVDHYVQSGRIDPTPNVAPTADFAVVPQNLKVTVNAAASTDPDGTIASYAWDFGDGQTGTGLTAEHTYAAAGTYQLKLTVTDNRGATASKVVPVTVAPPPNQAPTADYSVTKKFLKASFDGSASSDTDGTVASYAWDFGDGQSGTGAKPDHTYAAAGTYSVTLTVTDDQGATGTKTSDVTVTDNLAPTADYSVTKKFLKASFDGSASSDSDGTVASYAWNFGDGQSGTGAKPGHTYAAAGTYSVTLTVTDDQGATGTKTSDVTVTAPVNWATDAFSRNLTGGLGSADLGGAWSVTGGAANFSVSSGAAKLKIPTAGSTLTGSLPAVSATNTDTSMEVVLDKAQTGGGTYVKLPGRKVSGNTMYNGRLRFMPDGTVNLAIQKNVTGTETTLKSVVMPGVTYSAGDTMNIRFMATGTAPTTLKVKAWKAGTAEPDWALTTTDSQAGLQVAGSVGVEVYLSGTATNAPMTVSIDNFVSRKVA